MFIPQKIDDPVFGQMELIDDEICYQGSVLFAPLSQQIEIYVYSKSNGPSKNQHTLYREIEKRYSEWIEKLPSYVETYFPSPGRPRTTLEFTNKFEFSGIHIPELDATKNVWEIEYFTDGLDGWIEIQFINWEPTSFLFGE